MAAHLYRKFTDFFDNIYNRDVEAAQQNKIEDDKCKQFVIYK